MNICQLCDSGNEALVEYVGRKMCWNCYESLWKIHSHSLGQSAFVQKKESTTITSPKKASREKIRNIYTILCNKLLGDDANSVMTRVQLVEWLEQQTGCSFANTEEFHSKIEKFLLTDENDGQRLRDARKRKGWSQVMLGAHLGISDQYISNMEHNINPLIPKALRFILQQQVSDHAQPQFSGENDTDSKQVTGTEKGGQ